jgi:hypothetical protein
VDWMEARLGLGVLEEIRVGKTRQEKL